MGLFAAGDPTAQFDMSVNSQCSILYRKRLSRVVNITSVPRHIRHQRLIRKSKGSVINKPIGQNINKLVAKEGTLKLNLEAENYKHHGRILKRHSRCRHIPKAKATTMAETPELKRIAENTKIQSNVLYHAEFEKAKGKFTQVADDPETLRIKQNSKIISNVAYHGELEKKAAMEQKRVMSGENGESVGDADDLNMPPPPQVPPPAEPINHHHSMGVQSHHHHHHVPGKIADYDPLVEAPRNSPYSARQSATVIYTSDRGAVTSPPTRRVGSIADLDPVNNFYGSLSTDYRPPSSGSGSANNYNNHVVTTPIINQNQPTKLQSSGVYKAMYDYDAQDSDEVSFLDGDLIVNCTPIDEGWMTGLVQRTGQTGMLPANYVEPVN
ncbi:LIM and SH3 domain protein F42H10.3 isoform X2 [Periplaneta americana]|uniref:LIM and SH3 domain protein F42H10.3 isoform X2 n=1 Tax=Periplaneta americana TaxID=6978 RepID=UPI0037E871C3